MLGLEESSARLHPQSSDNVPILIRGSVQVPDNVEESLDLARQLTWQVGSLQQSIVISHLLRATNKDDVHGEVSEGPNQKLDHLRALSPFLVLR